MLISNLKKTIAFILISGFMGQAETSALTNKNGLLSDRQFIEVATGIASSMGSYFQHKINLAQEEKRSNLFPFFIQVIRVVNGVIMLNNHRDDFSRYNQAWLAIDIAQLCSRTSALAYSKIEGDEVDHEGEYYFDQALEFDEEQQAAFIEKQFYDETSSTDIIEDELNFVELESQFSDLRGIVLPAIEGLARIVMATCLANSTEAKRIRFTAQAVLSLTRLSESIYDTEGVTRKVLIMALVMHFGQVLYDGLYKQSAFNKSFYPFFNNGQIMLNGKDIGLQCELCKACWHEQREKPKDDTTIIISQMPCAHAFHKGCLSRWVDTYEHVCPLCQQKSEDFLLKHFDLTHFFNREKCNNRIACLQQKINSYKGNDLKDKTLNKYKNMLKFLTKKLKKIENNIDKAV